MDLTQQLTICSFSSRLRTADCVYMDFLSKGTQEGGRRALRGRIAGNPNIKSMPAHSF